MMKSLLAEAKEDQFISIEKIYTRIGGKGSEIFLVKKGGR
jgi:hypothetical protein